MKPPIPLYIAHSEPVKKTNWFLIVFVVSAVIAIGYFIYKSNQNDKQATR